MIAAAKIVFFVAVATFTHFMARRFSNFMVERERQRTINRRLSDIRNGRHG